MLWIGDTVLPMIFSALFSVSCEVLQSFFAVSKRDSYAQKDASVEHEVQGSSPSSAGL